MTLYAPERITPKTIRKLEKKMFFEFWLINKIFATISHPNQTNSLRALQLRDTLSFQDKISYYDDFITQYYLWNKNKSIFCFVNTFDTNNLKNSTFSSKKLHRQMYLEYWLIKKLFSVSTTHLVPSLPMPLTINKHLLLTALKQRYALSFNDKFDYYNSFENSYKVWTRTNSFSGA